MDITYVYTKVRSQFGRQPLFSDAETQILISLNPDETEEENFIEKDPVDMAVQYTPQMTEHEVICVNMVVIFLFSLYIIHTIG